MGVIQILNKKIILALSSLALICTSAYAGDPSIWKDRWRDSPLTSKTSNEWRKKKFAPERQAIRIKTAMEQEHMGEKPNELAESP
jgi:hypothetical protein